MRSEGLGGLPVAREALVWSVRSMSAAGAETPFEVRLRRFGRLDRSARDSHPCVINFRFWSYTLTVISRAAGKSSQEENDAFIIRALICIAPREFLAQWVARDRHT